MRRRLACILRRLADRLYPEPLNAVVRFPWKELRPVKVKIVSREPYKVKVIGYFEDDDAPPVRT